MSKDWTKEQLDAIDKEGTNIIVSAGAGSGKTAVLTERVIRKLKKGISLNQLLVLTFTNAAAHEMKERIRTQLNDDEALKNQLELLDAAYITTFDSFALSVVKKYHYLLNISSHVSICDSSILNMKKSSLIDTIFDELYQVEEPRFLKLISDLCVKDDTDIKNYILKINDKLDMKYDRDIYLSNYVMNAFSDLKMNNDIDELTNIIKHKCEHINQILSKLSMYVDSDYFNALELSLNPLLNSKTYDEYYLNLNAEIPKLPRNSDDLVKAYRTDISNVIKELKNICIWDNTMDIKKSIILTQDYIIILIDIIKELDKRLKEYKFEHDLYDFTDIANLSIKLVKENKNVRNELKDNFHEILVDEYQDTNDLQEAFISLISNHNVYMVGDIKQSIYRFNNANPDVFKDKYEQYKHNDNGLAIDLNKNFRSRSEVLSNINLIFDDVMDLAFGGADYRHYHRLECGNVLFDTVGKTNQNNNLEIYNYQYDKESTYTKEEMEIFIIANDIKDKINNHYQIFDSETKKLRDVDYSDFCIILDRGTNFDLYKRIFTFMKIPLIVYKDENVAATSDILVIKSLLKLILCLKHNKHDEEFKYAFMSIGRSFVCDYNDNDLFNFITNEAYKETSLYNIAYNISLISDTLSLDALLSKIISDFKIMEKIVTIGNVLEMTYRIESLIDNAASLSNMGYNLDDFITYLDDNFNDNNIKISLNKEVGNACRIMNIHKSKGLEFNLCYYAGLYATFNISDLKQLFYYDSYYGFIVPYFHEGINHTMYKTLLNEKYMKEEIEEKIRLFYVALTRCKEKMIMIADLDSKDIFGEKDKDGLVELSSRLSYRSFRDIILSVKDNLIPFIKNIDINDYPLSHDYNIWHTNNYQVRIPISNIEIDKRSINIDSKPIEELSYSKKVNKLIDIETKDSIDKGLFFHYCLETLDLKRPNLDHLNGFYQQKIISFLNQDLLKNIQASKIYKEYEFIYVDNDVEHHGIIDLMLEFEDHIKIIDYKFKYIDKDDYDNQLKGYQKYIESITNKRVELYLYSIMDEKYRMVS